MKTESPSLESAAARAMAGELGAFRVIVEGTSARLVRFGARLLGSVEEAEDVVQDSYVKAYQALQEGRFDARASVVTWLHRIVANRSIDAMRSRKRRQRHLELEHELVPSNSHSAETRVLLAELSRSLDGLSPEQRVVMVLRAVEGYSSREAADILEISEGAVEQRLVRARALLRERIQ